MFRNALIFLVVVSITTATMPLYSASKRPPKLRKIASDECVLQAATGDEMRPLDCKMTSELDEQFKMAVKPLQDAYFSKGQLYDAQVKTAEAVLSCLSQCSPCNTMNFELATDLGHDWAIKKTVQVKGAQGNCKLEVDKDLHFVVSGYGSSSEKRAATGLETKKGLLYSIGGRWKCHNIGGKTTRAAKAGSTRTFVLSSRGVLVQDAAKIAGKNEESKNKPRWIHFSLYNEIQPVKVNAVDSNTLRVLWPKQGSLEPYLELNHEGYPSNSNFVDSNIWMSSQCRTEYRRGSYYPKISLLDDSITEICEDGKYPPCK